MESSKVYVPPYLRKQEIIGTQTQTEIKPQTYNHSRDYQKSDHSRDYQRRPQQQSSYVPMGNRNPTFNNNNNETVNDESEQISNKKSKSKYLQPMYPRRLTRDGFNKIKIHVSHFNKFSKLYKEISKIYNDLVANETSYNKEIIILQKNLNLDLTNINKNISEKIYSSGLMKEFLKLATKINEFTKSKDKLNQLYNDACKLYNKLISPYEIFVTYTEISHLLIPSINAGWNIYLEKETYKVYLEHEFIEVYSNYNFKHRMEKFKELGDNITIFNEKKLTKFNDIAKHATCINDYEIRKTEFNNKQTIECVINNDNSSSDDDRDDPNDDEYNKYYND